MKKLLYFLAFLPVFCFGQKHRLTPLTNSISIDGRIFPMNTVVMNIRPDSLSVELDYLNLNYSNQPIIRAIVDTNYVNALTGSNFANVDSLAAFYQKYMVK